MFFDIFEARGADSDIGRISISTEFASATSRRDSGDLVHQSLRSASQVPHTRPFTLADFDYALPAELIAQFPLPVRSASRLLDGRTARTVDRQLWG